MFLYYWIFHKDIALNLLLGAYFLEWKKKQQSEWKQTPVSSYFSTPQTVVSLSPFIRWCALFLCLFYIPIRKNKSLQNIRLPRFCYWVKGKQNQESTLWNAQSKSISSHTKHIASFLKEGTHKMNWNSCVPWAVSSSLEFQRQSTYQLVFFGNYIKACTKFESVTVNLFVVKNLFTLLMLTLLNCLDKVR